MTFGDRPFLTPPERTPGFDITGWVLRVAAATIFLGVGVTKFSSDYWVRLFAEIGFGDWFRYLTGAIQVVAGLLFLVPRTTAAAAVLAGCTMVGAVVVHMFVLNTGFAGAVVPLALLFFIVVVAARQPE